MRENEGIKCAFYCAGVHKGGGAVLLRALILSLTKEQITKTKFYLDQRFNLIDLGLPSRQVILVKPTIRNRFFYQMHLWHHSKNYDFIHIFNSMPPIIKYRAKKITLYQQNHNIISSDCEIKFNIRTLIRIFFERKIFSLCIRNVDEVIFQTALMIDEFLRWKKKFFFNRNREIRISCIPFYHVKFSNNNDCNNPVKKIDFLYVSDDERHKNIDVLIKAWIELAKQGIRPSLALTIPAKSNTCYRLNEAIKLHKLNIINFGTVDHEIVLNLYKNVEAVIFPSISESYSLPLIEAQLFNLPVLASELEYVYQVCNPVYTFNPYSFMSIARSVKKYKKIEPNLPKISSPTSLINYLYEE